MTRILSLSVAIAFLAGLPQLQAGDPPSAPPPDAKKPQPAAAADAALKATADRFRSVWIVRDLAAFNILSLSSQKDGAWMVAGMYDGGSNSHNQGYYIETETGKVIDRGIRPAVVLQVWGKWKRIELLSGEAPPEGRYQWKEPDRSGISFDRSKSIYDYSPVFAGPDLTMVCRYFEKKSGAEQFSPVTTIPDDWKTFVKPAYEYHVQHWVDFADSDLNGLRKLASGENPFVALTAIRHLLGRTTTAEETDQLLDVARSLPKYRQAVLTFWLLKRNSDNARDIIKRYPDNSDFLEREKRLKKNDENTLELVLKPVSRAISRAKSAAELTGMALGIESWTATQGRMVGDSGRDLIQKVLERWQSFDRSTAASWEKILIAPGNPEGKSTQTNKSDGAKPPLEPRNDSKKGSKSSGFKERVRFNFTVHGPFQTEPIMDDVVTVNEPFNIRAKNGATATGVLRRTAEGGLHFKGEVSRGRTAVFDAPVGLGLVELGKAPPGVLYFGIGRLASAPKGGGHDLFDVGFSLSHVQEHVRRGPKSEGDRMIVVPGPQAEKQTPSEWFDGRLKAENVLTADKETWVLFRSKQLNRTLMWIERIERDENTFTVTMNGPEATAGDDHYEVHGVNLGKLPTGTYEVKWIIRSGKGGRPPKDSKPAEPVELKSSFKVLEK